MNVQTLRYYERRGLLAARIRRPFGQREYSEDAVRLRTIKAAQRLGFTLAEIEELLDLSATGAAPTSCTSGPGQGGRDRRQDRSGHPDA